ncbi:MAG: aminotransferase class I/II-fold pyridoxal phosphate-dependent enzyme, partial [Pseudomonadota bacterium]
PSYRQILRSMNVEPVGLPTTMENRYQPVPGDLDGAGPLAGLIVASPANPTGTMLDRAALQALVSAAQARDMALISDEIYHGIEYDQPAETALSVSDDVYVINSFSKYYSMTGWRIGWMVVPEALIRTVENLAQNLFICPPHASQVAALAAMDCDDECQANLKVYARNRELLLDGLPKAGFRRIAPPDGAFYIYADVSDLTTDSLGFARDILETSGVAVTPGLDFDQRRGGGTLRFSYAGSTEDMEEALARLTGYMERFE